MDTQQILWPVIKEQEPFVAIGKVITQSEKDMQQVLWPGMWTPLLQYLFMHKMVIKSRALYCYCFIVINLPQYHLEEIEAILGVLLLTQKLLFDTKPLNLLTLSGSLSNHKRTFLILLLARDVCLST